MPPPCQLSEGVGVVFEGRRGVPSPMTNWVPKISPHPLSLDICVGPIHRRNQPTMALSPALREAVLELRDRAADWDRFCDDQAAGIYQSKTASEVAYAFTKAEKHVIEVALAELADDELTENHASPCKALQDPNSTGSCNRCGCATKAH